MYLSIVFKNKTYQYITMDEINIFNLYDHVTMTFDNNLLKIEWDSKNPTLNSLMLLEKQPYLFFFQSSLFVME